MEYAEGQERMTRTVGQALMGPVPHEYKTGSKWACGGIEWREHARWPINSPNYL